jgi:regulator of replication initiation timing
MDNIEDIRNSIVVSLATSGGIVVKQGRNTIRLTVSFPNQDPTIAEKEIFKSYIISKDDLYELECEAQELHAQINAMIEEEEAKKAEEEKIRIEEQRKKDEEKRVKQREARAAKKKQDEKTTEKDKGDK